MTDYDEFLSRGADFDVLHNVAPGKHLYQFYKNTEDYLRIITQFLRAGLEKGEAGVWLVSQKIGIGAVLDYLDQNLPRLSFYDATGQLQILSAEDWYLKRGRFDEDQAMLNLKRMILEMEDKGFPSIRGIGDAAAIPRADWARAHEYDAKINNMIKSSSMIALCVFPILECSISDTKTILDNHEDVLIGRV